MAELHIMTIGCMRGSTIQRDHFNATPHITDVHVHVRQEERDPIRKLLMAVWTLLTLNHRTKSSDSKSDAISHDVSIRAEC